MVNSYKFRKVAAQAGPGAHRIEADLQEPTVAKCSYSGKLLKGVHTLMLSMAMACTIATASAQELPFKHTPEKCSTSEVQISGHDKKIKIGIDYELEKAYARFRKGKMKYEDLRAMVTYRSADIVRANNLPNGKLAEVSNEILQQLECNYQDWHKKPKARSTVSPKKASPAPQEERKYESEYSTLPNGVTLMTQRFAEPPSKPIIGKFPKPPAFKETTIYAMPHEEYIKLVSKREEPKNNECLDCRSPEQEDEIGKIILNKVLEGIAESIEMLDSSIRNRISELDFAMEQILSQETLNPEAVNAVLSEVAKIQGDLAAETERIRQDLDDYPKEAEEDRKAVDYLLEKMHNLDVYITKKRDDYVYATSMHSKASVQSEIDQFSQDVRNRVEEIGKAVEQLLVQHNPGSEQPPPEQIIISNPKIEMENTKENAAFIAEKLFNEIENLELAVNKQTTYILPKIDACAECTDKASLRMALMHNISYVNEKKEEYGYILSKYVGNDLLKRASTAAGPEISEIEDEGQAPAEAKAKVAEPVAAAEEKKEEKRVFALSLPISAYYSETAFLGKQFKQWGTSAPLVFSFPCAEHFGISVAAAGDANYYEFSGSRIVEQWASRGGVGFSLLLRDGDENEWVLSALTTFSNDNKGIAAGGLLSIKSNIMDAGLIATLNRPDPVKFFVHARDTNGKYPFAFDSHGIYSKSRNGLSEYEMVYGNLRAQFPLGYDLPAYVNIVAGLDGKLISASPNQFSEVYGMVGASVTWKYVNVGAGALLGEQHSRRFIPGIGTYEHEGITYNGRLERSGGFRYGYTVFGSFKMANIRDVLSIRTGVEYSSVGKDFTVIPELSMIIVW